LSRHPLYVDRMVIRAIMRVYSHEKIVDSARTCSHIKREEDGTWIVTPSPVDDTMPWFMRSIHEALFLHTSRKRREADMDNHGGTLSEWDVRVARLAAEILNRI
jgi:hypothetical protein